MWEKEDRLFFKKNQTQQTNKNQRRPPADSATAVTM